ncbi:MAG: 3-hydroxybutyryl-CoA dehydrogenase [Burkholderiaceae bacterium]|jgi:3-hydroxybutyryl-CoA dehydrogenase|nr:3-hydroxybutyryl-CoA dehydrogenase [Burkholderiales bacterium]NCA10004.1 3-hydroxybutyryl-CoA dehydrogenase [Burkholderiaceae bacterium]NCU93325.1 3-hydroxybutyryl-CoA dehydrogenase [Burkholderiaceae bacterium]NCV71846.1 3-hydroxybutyryl-CoA dehydrogenase [Burkholderiaceae bacterium]NCV78236.1 3-hydroxybutyryl-CoA dehydrogenase [Burkholderiaceae bacterium]
MTITSIGIIGAGTMGNGIAQVAASAGYDVVLLDVSDAALEKGLAALSNSLDRLIKKEVMNAEQKSQTLARIKTTTHYADLAQVSLVIEAATENQAIKESILQQVDQVVSNDTIIASNTSSISITHLGSRNSRPERFIGIHFFNPPPLMALIEVIMGKQTSPETLKAVLAMATRMGKEPITVQSSPGFVVNRILLPMINEAFFVLHEGIASPEDIDTGMKLGCNHPIGPLALADLIGLDTCLAIMEVYHKEFKDDKYRPSPYLIDLVAKGHLGRKTGRGVYAYDKK